MRRFQRSASGRRLLGALFAIVWFGTLAAASATPQEGTGNQVPPSEKPLVNDPEGILNLDIEQLARTPVVVPSMDIPVTSVTKEPSTVGRSPAAVFVITQEMIRRSGATSIPEALRMAPGLDVGQVNSNTWAISSRGFNYAYANKLLVLIDGRSVYNPDFSGVFWNVEDVLMVDIERIEVIRGPGGTLWGANAVNGVINIITKRAKDTQGVYVMAGGGSHEKMLDGFRYGGQINEDLAYRVYGKHFERGPNYDPSDQGSDAWRQGRFGFRADWEPDRDRTNTITVQGAHYVGDTDSSILPTDHTLTERLTGENLLVRWRHVYDEDSDWTLQAYYDNYTRIDALQKQIDKTFDVDFQYRFPLGSRHSITCGAGFRNVESFFPGGDQFVNWFPSPNLTTNYTSQFIQDEITVFEDRLTFTLGCKLEQNPYTGLEYQPTARVLWTPDRRHSAWGAVSRAVRTPSRIDEQANITFAQVGEIFDLPLYPRLYGNRDAQFGSHDLVSEALVAYEIGYREQTTEQFSWDIATFWNVYDHIIVSPTHEDLAFLEMAPFPHFVLPVVSANGPAGDTYGVELAANYSVSKRWRLYCQYTLFEMHLYNNPEHFYEDDDPHNQVYFRSSWDLREDLEFDLMARYIDRLIFSEIPSYISLDLRLAYRPRKHLELAVVGQNLLQGHHFEASRWLLLTTEVPRGVYGTVTWRH